MTRRLCLHSLSRCMRFGNLSMDSKGQNSFLPCLSDFGRKLLPRAGGLGIGIDGVYILLVEKQESIRDVIIFP